jgi:hypothetical protein
VDLVDICQKMEYLKAQSNELEEEVRARILKTCVEA